jgi:hypothetical protein
MKSLMGIYWMLFVVTLIPATALADSQVTLSATNATVTHDSFLKAASTNLDGHHT